MKKYYKIKEISDLYNIQTDSLRYYEEMDLIHPLRSSSNYRLYTINDIYVLNIIRDCLKLGYSTNQIKEYLNNRSMNQTISFLKEEKDIIEQKIIELQNSLKSIENRLNSLNQIHQLNFNTIEIKEFDCRTCFRLKRNIDQDASVDYYLTELMKKNHLDVSILGDFNSGSIIDKDTYQYDSVFILSNRKDCDFLLKKGSYCIYTYKGNYVRSNEIFIHMKQWLKERGFEVEDFFYEFLLVDIHETMNPDEYVTQIQAKIKGLAI